MISRLLQILLLLLWLPASIPLFKRTRSRVSIWISCSVGTLSAEILSHQIHHPQKASCLFSSASVLFLLDFSTKSTSFCVQENPVEPWTVLLYANFAWCKLDLTLLVCLHRCFAANYLRCSWQLSFVQQYENVTCYYTAMMYEISAKR